MKLKKKIPLTLGCIYNLSVAGGYKGVPCPECGKMPMKRVHGRWDCPFCHKNDKSTHSEALCVDFLPVDSSITRKKFKEFVRRGSIDTAKRLLSGINFPFLVENKSRNYPKSKNLTILTLSKKEYGVT